MQPTINITPPDKFKTVPWKNGLGETIEIAINSGGTLECFDWRISMASVVEDGVFSNFEGYTRHLILIDGNGINLQHNDSKIDKLYNLLDMATFDGGNKTVGNLHASDITDFNIITRTERISANVIAKLKLKNYALEFSQQCFIYSLYRDAELLISEPKLTTNAYINKTIALPAQHLIALSNIANQNITVTGTHLIIVYLTEK